MHEQILKNFFKISYDQLYDNSFTPNLQLLYNPVMLLKFFNISKNNKIIFNRIYTFLANSIVPYTPATKNHIIIKSSLLVNQTKCKVTNYYPIFLFNTSLIQKKTYSYNNKKATMYHNSTTTRLKPKYKVFFTFFLITFLENYLKKKV